MFEMSLFSLVGFFCGGNRTILLLVLTTLISVQSFRLLPIHHAHRRVLMSLRDNSSPKVPSPHPSTSFVAQRRVLAFAVLISFPALSHASTPSVFDGSLESRVLILEANMFTKKDAASMEQERKAERLADIKRMEAERQADIKRMDAKMKAMEQERKAERQADIKRTDAASNRSFALSLASFAIASSTTLRGSIDAFLRPRVLAPRSKE